MVRNLEWSYAEVLLALDLYLNRPADKRNPPEEQIIELAQLLGRSHGAVSRKLGNIKAIDPDYEGTGLERGGSFEKPLLKMWSARRPELKSEADRIRASMSIKAFTMDGTKRERRRKHREKVARSVRLSLMSEDELRELILRNRKAASMRKERGIGSIRCESSRRVGQGSFEDGVLAQYYLAMRSQKWLLCPGCRHGRLKMNGDPLLEAHHVIQWAETESADSRWGVPLCPNCHWLVEVGSIRTKQDIYRSVCSTYPQILTNLKELRFEGMMDDIREKWLRMEGLL